METKKEGRITVPEGNLEVEDEKSTDLIVGMIKETYIDKMTAS